MDLTHQELVLLLGLFAAAVIGLLLFVGARLTIRRMNREIAARRNAERDLTLSESRLREAMQGTETGLWDWNPQTGDVYYDPVWFTMLGYQPDAMPHSLDTFSSLLHPDDQASALQIIGAAASGKRERFEVEFRMRRSDGSYSWILSKGRLLKSDTSGNPSRWIGIHSDLTERKKAQEALQESEQRFSRLVAQSPVSIQVHNLDGELVMHNTAYAHLYALNQQALAGLYEKYNVRQDEQARKLGLAQFVERVYLGEDVVFPPYEYNGIDTLKTLDIENPVSKNSWVQTIGFPIKDENGNVTSAVFMSEDISERKQAEQAIADYQNRLKELAYQLSRTEEKERRSIAIDLHDRVGQSLAVMRMQLAAAIGKTKEPEVVKSLEDVSDSLRQAIQETRSIMYDISSPMISELGLSAAISEWLEVNIGEQYGLRTLFGDDGADKPLSDDTSSLLFRHVRELLVNVVKHANASQVSVKITRHDNTIQILVEDDGKGLNKQQTAEHKQSRGFGLFSIEERMRDLGGSLLLENLPGKGVRAVITAPLEES